MLRVTGYGLRGSEVLVLSIGFGCWLLVFGVVIIAQS